MKVDYFPDKVAPFVFAMQILLAPFLFMFAMGNPRKQSFRAATETRTTIPESTQVTPNFGIEKELHIQKNEIYVRQFESARDQKQLETICRHVFQGNDYLPRLAKSLEKDELSQFFVLTRRQQSRDDDGDDDHCNNLDEQTTEILLACANIRTLSEQHLWLEAVRTAPEYRNKGYARTLLETILLHHLDSKTNVYTCTVASNTPMIRVFEKLNMKFVTNIHLLEWSTLLQIPGWKATDTASNQIHLLQGLGLSASELGGVEMEKSLYWQTVSTTQEVEQTLKSIRSQGGLGWLPALFEILSVRGPVVQEALQNRMVWRLQRRRLTIDDGSNDDCLIALIRDPRIQSLKSSWVLCVAGTREEHVRCAVKYGCSSDLQRQLLLLEKQSGTGRNMNVSVEENVIGFVLAVDGTISKDGDFMRLLPWGKDPCVVYSKNVNLL